MGQHQMGHTAETLGAITQLRSWHREIARYSLMGKRPSEIALVIDLSEQQISRILGSPLMIAEIERLQTLADYEAIDMAVAMKMRQGKALEAIDRGLTQGDDHKAAQIGFEILDRTGFPKGAPVQKHLHLHAHKEVDNMPLDDLQEEAMKLITSDEE